MANDSKQPDRPPVTTVLVHGLWMSGFQLQVLRHRLEAGGQLRVLAFTYPTVSGSMSDHVRKLLDFAHAQDVAELHFVGHSLGGLVILRALQLTDDLPPGRAGVVGHAAARIEGGAGRRAHSSVRQSDFSVRR